MNDLVSVDGDRLWWENGKKGAQVTDENQNKQNVTETVTPCYKCKCSLLLEKLHFQAYKT